MFSTLPEIQMPALVRRPKAYGYGRQSDRDAIDANEGIPQQGIRIRRYFDANLAAEGVEWGDFIPDESAVSARTNPFLVRHAGQTLFTLLQPGDHFIIDKIDRLWRSIEDFVSVTQLFKQREIKLHICNLMGLGSVTLGTPMGDFMLNLMVCIAQLESDQSSNRTKARFADRRSLGRYPGSPTPIGCRLVGKVEKEKGQVIRDNRLLVWCPDLRRFMGEIVRLADEERLNCSDVRARMGTHFRQFMGDKFFKDVIGPKDWTAFTIAKYYWREKQYQALPPFDPNTIKFSVFDLPKSAGKVFRDIGHSEPSTPNLYPFLDGRPIPTVMELRRMAA